MATSENGTLTRIASLAPQLKAEDLDSSVLGDEILARRGLTTNEIDALRQSRDESAANSRHVSADATFQLALLIESLVDFFDDIALCCRSVWIADPSGQHEMEAAFFRGAKFTRVDYARENLVRLKFATAQARESCILIGEESDWFADVAVAVEALRCELDRVRTIRDHRSILKGLVRAKRTTRKELVFAAAKLRVVADQIMRSEGLAPRYRHEIAKTNGSSSEVKWATALSPSQIARIFDRTWKVAQNQLSVFGGQIKSKRLTTKSYLIDESALPNGWESKKRSRPKWN